MEASGGQERRSRGREGGRRARGHIGNSLLIPPSFSVESEEELQGAGLLGVCREM